MPAFLAWQINQPPFQRELWRTAEGSSQLSLRRPVLEELPVTVASEADQQRIVKLVRLAQRERELQARLIRNHERLFESIALPKSWRPPDKKKAVRGEHETTRSHQPGKRYQRGRSGPLMATSFRGTVDAGIYKRLCPDHAFSQIRVRCLARNTTTATSRNTPMPSPASSMNCSRPNALRCFRLTPASTRASCGTLRASRATASASTRPCTPSRTPTSASCAMCSRTSASTRTSWARRSRRTT